MNAETLYSKIADSYDVTLTLAGYKMAVEYFIRRIPIERHKEIRILDAGCGTGFYSLALLKRFPNSSIVAFDLNRKMLDKLRSKLMKKGLDERVRLFRTDMVDPLPYDRQDFDMIVTAGVLEYVRIEEAVSNLTQYLKRNGYWVNSPIKTNLFGQLVGKLYQLQPYTRDENIDVFHKNGYVLEKIVEFLALKEAHIFKKIR